MIDSSTSEEILELSKSATSTKKAAHAFSTVKESLIATKEANKLFIQAIGFTEKKSELLAQLLAKIEQSHSLLEEEIKDLKYKNRHLLVELREAMKISGKQNDIIKESESVQKKSNNTKDSCDKPERSKKRGAPIGHKGKSRPIPKDADRTVDIPPPNYCECGCTDILENEKYDTKYIEDIPLVSKQITKLRYKRGRCSLCGKDVRHEDAIKGPPIKIGPVLSAYLALLKQNGVTYGKLSLISTDIFGVSLSRSGILGIVARVSETLREVYETIGHQVRLEEIVHADETTWKVRGVQWYVWVFCNRNLAYFHAIKSRATAVVEDVLGKNFKGIAVCDFYAAYNVIERTQRCLVHLLRDIKKEREVLINSKLLDKFDERLKTFISKGLDVQKMPESIEKKKEIKRLRRMLTSIAKMKVTKGKAETLQKRITKYHDDICRFLETPDLEYHNNRAERQVRPLVIERKNSFGSDTPGGAERMSILHSVIETCKLQGKSPTHLIGNAISEKFNHLNNNFLDMYKPINIKSKSINLSALPP